MTSLSPPLRNVEGREMYYFAPYLSAHELHTFVVLGLGPTSPTSPHQYDDLFSPPTTAFLWRLLVEVILSAVDQLWIGVSGRLCLLNRALILLKQVGFHVNRQVGWFEDPNSAQSSFSMLLGDAPHLDGQYAIFGRITRGDDTLKKFEQLPTRREDTEMESCEKERSVLKRRLAASAVEIEKQHVCLCLFIFQYLTNAIVSDLALSCVVFAENEMLPMILQHEPDQQEEML
uniref:PPIase cyclophilin-type domain-containing protein n=1 Tax=Fagus sylvatica TaxID=28930 RepID=A0A2N9J0B7_FAGSY